MKQAEPVPQWVMLLNARGRIVPFPRRPLVMGILNITDDSFSGDGRIDTEWALQRAAEMTAQGADIIDVGGESARTNRSAIPPMEEFLRMAPFIESFPKVTGEWNPRNEEQIFPPLLSINTWRTETAKMALHVGGDILNDIGGLPDDGNARICAKTGAALVIMHSQGAPKVPHTHVAYDNIMVTLQDFFREKLALARSVGLSEDSLILDPGIDFAKQAPDNLKIYRELEVLQKYQRPILLPISRKSVIGRVLEIAEPKDRDAGTIACLVAGVLRGASILRVHNVEAAVLAIRTVRLLEASPK